MTGQRPHVPLARVPDAVYRKSLIAATRTFQRHQMEPQLMLTDAWRVPSRTLNEVSSKLEVSRRVRKHV